MMKKAESTYSLEAKRRSSSSESDFYGSKDEQARLESICDKFDAAKYLKRPPTMIEQMLRLRSETVVNERASRTAKGSLPTQTSDSKLNTTKDKRKEFNPFAHEISAWQLNEAPEDFIERLPPSRTLESDAGPWIWAANPYSQHRETSSDYRGLSEDGEEVLQELTTIRDKIGRKESTKYTDARLRAQEMILRAAEARNIKTGKWLLFRNAQEIDEAWAAVATGTIKGELGCSAKVATRKSLTTGALDQVICVYTENFADEKDVIRVLQELDRRGLVGRYGPFGGYKGIYYKPDVYTHLGISSGNSWNIPPSLYASTSFIPPKARDS